MTYGERYRKSRHGPGLLRLHGPGLYFMSDQHLLQKVARRLTGGNYNDDYEKALGCHSMSLILGSDALVCADQFSPSKCGASIEICFT
jgi:hypothetical protein